MKYFTLAFVFLLISCETVTTEYVENNEKPFFDLKSYFEHEIASLQNKSVTKKVTIDEKSETKIIEQFNIKKALSDFLDSDINKPQLFDKYKTKEKNTQITYTSIDKNLKVQQIDIFKNSENEIEKIIINRKADTAIYTSDKVLTYIKNEGFSIKNKQNTLFSEAKNYSIVVNF